MNLEKQLSFLGHKKSEAMLAHSVATGKIFPTWIFCGPFGVGKATLAHKFAKCLLSGVIPDGDQLDCGENNPVHRLVETRTHPDLFVLEQQEETVSIDETRSLMSKIRKTPSMSKWRVVILENASNLNKNICNSLLKILEEPPENTVFILICTNTGYLPKTLLSRASVINFSPLDYDSVLQVLEEKGIENPKKLAMLADGSVGYAIYLHNNGGIEIYENLLKAFKYSPNGSEYKKVLKSMMENNLTTNFRIIKKSIMRILKIYADMLTGTECGNCKEEIKILETNIVRRGIKIDDEIGKILEIISMLGKSDSMMLEKTSVLLYVFERFFAE